MIHHQSSPEGIGVNDSISAEPLSLLCVSIEKRDHHHHVMPTAGLFVQARCAQCISADHSPPSGLFWEGSNYYERFLPFGLRSSPAFFDSVATAVNWFMQHEFAIDHHLHYLEEFLHIFTGLVAANQQLTIPLRAFTYLGIPPCYIQA